MSEQNIKQLLDTCLDNWQNYSFAERTHVDIIMQGRYRSVSIEKHVNSLRCFLTFNPTRYDVSQLEETSPLFEDKYIISASLLIPRIIELKEKSCGCDMALQDIHWSMTKMHWVVYLPSIRNIRYCGTCGAELPILESHANEANRFERIGSGL